MIAPTASGIRKGGMRIVMQRNNYLLYREIWDNCKGRRAVLGTILFVNNAADLGISEDVQYSTVFLKVLGSKKVSTNMSFVLIIYVFVIIIF